MGGNQVKLAKFLKFSRFVKVSFKKGVFMNKHNLVYLVIITITFLFSELLFAYQVDLDSCKKAAEGKIFELGKSNEFSIKEIVNIQNEDEQILLHVFLLDSKGYLITTNETDLPPVIAYSFSNNFDHEMEENVLIKILKADIHNRLENILHLPDNLIEKRNLKWEKYLDDNIENDNDRPFEQWPPEGTTPTGGWLEENWHQNSPYNNFCPMQPFTSDRAVAGCPAVAMAQILNFHQTTNDTQFDDNDDYFHNYSSYQYWIDDDFAYWSFPSFPQLNDHLDILNEHYQNDETVTNDDKAAITFACGVAAQQVYTPEVSGTFGVDQAFQAYQRFNFETTDLLDEDDDLYDRISNNMMDALPVHLAVVNLSWTMGHNVVIDGYNTDEYYHLNFGWGGSYNGWYLLPDEIPYGLTVVEGAIVDINFVEISIDEGNEFVKDHLELSNYPNPFNSSTTISFYVTQTSSFVTLEIYNIKGQKVHQLRIKNYELGMNEVVWNGKDESGKQVNSGIYFYTLKTDRFSQTKKMVLTK